MWKSAAMALAVVLLLATAQVTAEEDKPEVPEHSDREVDQRIVAALHWLKDHQNVEGYWSVRGYAEDSKRRDAERTGNLEWVTAESGVEDKADVAATSLALLAFTGAGYDHREPSDFRNVVRQGVTYLRRIQSDTGEFGTGDATGMLYRHAIATMAMSEVYALTVDPILRPVAQRGLKYLLESRKEDGGWGDADGSNMHATFWAILALKAVEMAGIDFDSTEAYEGANRWLETVTGEEDGVTRTGFRKPGDEAPRPDATKDWAVHPDTDAMHMLVRLFTDAPGWKLDNEVLQSQAALLAANPAKWEEKQVDLLYWYSGTLTLFQFGGEHWESWVKPLTHALLSGQRGFRDEDKDGDEFKTAKTLQERGSWDAVGVWHPEGGRVVSTALSTLTLEAIARYRRLSAWRD
jgi:hypothetical protein